ncbi:hypothetical protein B0H14DRAFT_2556958 [Mycena olivaceomarginata]|nr:hypothetical protein B0H14DRAFT_2556958 [Mycena olivaceomarginata]
MSDESGDNEEIFAPDSEEDEEEFWRPRLGSYQTHMCSQLGGGRQFSWGASAGYQLVMNLNPAFATPNQAPHILNPAAIPPESPISRPIAPPWPTSSWVPESTGPYRDLFERTDVTSAIYQAATDHGSLELDGPSIDILSAYYVGAVREAVDQRDFTPLLRSRRRVRVLKPDGDIFSFGSGVEAEVVYTALNQRRPPLSGYFNASAPLLCYLNDLRAFGALLDLSLISGKGVGDVSPALIQYALNNSNLDSLTPSFVAAWNPRLDREVRQLQAAGPEGDLVPFESLIINTLNMQTAPLVYRDQNQHNMLVTQVVHTALLGPDIHGHPEMKAFAEGLELPCANGFSFGKLARSYPGGTEFSLPTLGLPTSPTISPSSLTSWSRPPRRQQSLCTLARAAIPALQAFWKMPTGGSIRM